MSDEIKSERSLANLCYDLLELDFEAPENAAIIEKTFSALGTKVDNYVRFDTFVESQIDRLKKEAEFIEKQIKSFERIQDNLKNRALFALKTLNVKELSSETGHKMQIRKSRSVKINDASALPQWAIKQTITVTPNKTKIAEALKLGELVAGATFEENEYIYLK